MVAAVAGAAMSAQYECRIGFVWDCEGCCAGAKAGAVAAASVQHAWVGSGLMSYLLKGNIPGISHGAIIAPAKCAPDYLQWWKFLLPLLSRALFSRPAV